jgi:L-threonylcarbamoyladenylate synthase
MAPLVTERLSSRDAPRAVALLRAGSLVAFPTETVYGLGADAGNPEAIAAIFLAKDRPRFNPLICHYPDADAAFADVQAETIALRLATRFWPGPLSLVLPRRPDCRVDWLAGAGLDTLAVRVPGHALALDILRQTRCPIAAPSANRSGAVSPTTAEHVLDELSGRIAAVVDGGPCPVGVESTVIDLTGPTPVLLRPGGVPIEAISAEIGPVHLRAANGQSASSLTVLRSPGLMTHHYAPTLPLRLGAGKVGVREALLAFGPHPLAGSGLVWNLSEAGDLAEAAARLFAGLRWLDREGTRLGFTGIAAMSLPDAGLGAAINDRLARAAAPRTATSEQP